MSESSELIYKIIPFTETFSEYDDLIVLKPKLPIGANWGYLGPKAQCNTNEPDNALRGGLIVHAKDGSTALCEIGDWEPVFIDIEQRKFSTWRGIPRDPGYVVLGHIFITGVDKPTEEQTRGLKAISKDLISEREPHHLVWQHRLPKAIISLWDIVVVDRLHIPTGAFVSTGGDSADGLQLGVLRFNA